MSSQLPTMPRAAIDPVCGMTVNGATARHSFTHAGETYYFCCAGCAEKFRAEPAKFLAKSRNPAGFVTLGSPVLAAIAPADAKPSPPEQRAQIAMDPVCGMSVDPTTSKHRLDYKGQTYHFCSGGCV